MPRINVIITPEQHRRLKFISYEESISISQSARMAIDTYLDKYSKKKVSDFVRRKSSEKINE